VDTEGFGSEKNLEASEQPFLANDDRLMTPFRPSTFIYKLRLGFGFELSTQRKINSQARLGLEVFFRRKGKFQLKREKRSPWKSAGIVVDSRLRFAENVTQSQVKRHKFMQFHRRKPKARNAERASSQPASCRS
jgi:hypothetical protein